MDRRRFLQCAASGMAVLATSRVAHAQQYPIKLIRYLVGFPPGGSADLTMRQYAYHLDVALGAKHVIENVPGASSTLAALPVVRGEPDGHTLYLGSNTSQTIAPAMLKLSYDPLTALRPISQMTSNASVVAISKDFGVTTWAEFVAKAKAGNQSVFCGTSNVGFQIPMFQISKLSGVKLDNVPFKGGAETVAAVLGGSIPMVLGTPPSILPHVESGALVALCVTTPQRSPVMPTIPGAEEVGLTGLHSTNWFGLYAPAKTPAPIIEKLHAAIQSVMKQDALQKALAQEGMSLVGSDNPAAFAAFQKTDFEETGALIREAGLKPN